MGWIGEAAYTKTITNNCPILVLYLKEFKSIDISPVVQIILRITSIENMLLQLHLDFLQDLEGLFVAT